MQHYVSKAEKQRRPWACMPGGSATVPHTVPHTASALACPWLGQVSVQWLGQAGSRRAGWIRCSRMWRWCVSRCAAACARARTHLYASAQARPGQRAALWYRQARLLVEDTRWEGWCWLGVVLAKTWSEARTASLAQGLACADVQQAAVLLLPAGPVAPHLHGSERACRRQRLAGQWPYQAAAQVSG